MFIFYAPSLLSKKFRLSFLVYLNRKYRKFWAHNFTVIRTERKKERERDSEKRKIILSSSSILYKCKSLVKCVVNSRESVARSHQFRLCGSRAPSKCYASTLPSHSLSLSLSLYLSLSLKYNTVKYGKKYHRPLPL